jgi:lysyl endopeptidase
MLFRKTLILVFLSLSGGLVLHAQVEKSGTPISWNPVLQIEPIDTWENVQVHDAHDLQFEDAEDGLLKNKPYRFAYNKEVNISVSDHGKWTNLHNGDRVWMVGLRSEGAHSITVSFKDFNIPAGSYVYVYNSDHSDYLGPLSWDDNISSDHFNLRPVNGDEIVVEYYEPIENYGQGKLKIGSISHAYRELQSMEFGDRSCIELFEDKNYPEFTNLSSSVMMMLVDESTRAASGILVNNTRNDGTPYFLTTVNALIGDPSTWVFIVNFTSERYSTNPEDCFSRALIGAEVLYTDQVSGIALLKLKDAPLREWRTYYSGWDFDALYAGKYSCLQHSLGRMQSIATLYGLPQETTWDNWKVLELEGWDSGNTFSGSVGSPLFNSRGLLVSHYLGGNSECNSHGEEYFCRVNESWNGLREYLDPINSSTGAYIGYFAIAQASDDVKAPQEFDIFPNPATDKIYVRNNSDYPVINVRIKDNAGRFVQYEVPTFPEVDISFLPDGVYHVIVETTNGSFLRRVIKQ